MAIQHINMGVPVGQPEKEVVREVAEDAASLASLEARCGDLCARISSGNWRASRRAANQMHFATEAKALIKKFASTVAAEVPDRDARTVLRTRLYADLLTLAQSVYEGSLRRQHRSQRIIYWLLGSVALLGCSAGMGLAMLVVGLI